MSGFVCVLDRSGAALEAEGFERLTEPLESPGQLVSRSCSGPVGIAVRHSPEPFATSRHGPLVSPGAGSVVAVAGRFALVGAEGNARPGQGTMAAGCAAWVLAQDAHLEPRRLARVSGAFALIAADPAAGWLSVARDHLGAFKVYYYLDARWLVAASNPAAVFRHPAVSVEPDEMSAARFLGFRFAHGGRSFFRRIEELPPAHQLRVSAGEASTIQYWAFRRLPGPATGHGSDPPSALLAAARAAVAAESDGIAPERLAISLSGGLDSTAVAALAPRGTRAFSWTFDETPESDERDTITAVVHHLGLPHDWVSGDGLEPLRGDFAERYVTVASPHLNAFAALKHRLFEAARAAGCERILVGDGGDTLYAAEQYWLRDLLASRGTGSLRSLAGAVRRAARGEQPARLALRRLVPLSGIRRILGWSPAPWLTPKAQSLLPAESPAPILPPGRRPHRFELTAGARHIELESDERLAVAAWGIERANPLWSWPLLELAMSLPAYWLYRDGTSKVIAREALRALLPATVVNARRHGSLGPFFLRGIAASREQVRIFVFERPRSDWQRYVRRDWVEPYLSQTREIGFGHTILWRVISYELWQRRLAGA